MTRKHLSENQLVINSIKHGGGCVMVWGCFATSGLIYEFYALPEQNVWPSIYELMLRCIWVLQQYNDYKSTNKSISEWLKNNQN